MVNDLAQLAISAALAGDWKKALEINSQLVRKNPNDIDAHNRLAKAYAGLGKIKKALQTCNKVLKIDPYNTIASKCAEKWKIIKKSDLKKSSTNTQSYFFLEEPGKTKIVSLINLGDSELIVKLDSGDEVKIVPHSHRVCITTLEGKYIGKLPDDLSARLKTLINKGNEYQVFIKCAEPSDVKVFIRESKKSEDLVTIPSFPSEKVEYISFAPPQARLAIELESDGEEN